MRLDSTNLSVQMTEKVKLRVISMARKIDWQKEKMTVMLKDLQMVKRIVTHSD